MMAMIGKMKTIGSKANPSAACHHLNGFMRRNTSKQKQPSKIPNFQTRSLNMWVDGENLDSFRNLEKERY
jgi:phage terminase large subunit-like protein